MRPSGEMLFPPPMPEGLRYLPRFVSAAEEADLARQCEALTFDEVRMHGVVAKRTVAHFGWRYGFTSWAIEPCDSIPAFLLPLRERCAALIDLPPEPFAEALVIRYPPGAGIGWHRDAPMFGPTVIGVSLLSPCRMRFQRTVDERRETYALELEPGSAYVLAGSARSEWQHSIPSTPALRYSITFRTVSDEAKRRERAGRSGGQ